MVDLVALESLDKSTLHFENIVKDNKKRFDKKENQFSLFQYAIKSNDRFLFLLNLEGFDPSIFGNTLLTICIDREKVGLVSALLSNQKVIEKLKRQYSNGIIEKNGNLIPKREKLEKVINSIGFDPSIYGSFYLAKTLVPNHPLLAIQIINMHNGRPNIKDPSTKSIDTILNGLNISSFAKPEDYLSLLVSVFTHPHYEPIEKSEWKRLLDLCSDKIVLVFGIKDPSRSMMEIDHYVTREELRDLLKHLENRAIFTEATLDQHNPEIDNSLVNAIEEMKRGNVITIDHLLDRYEDRFLNKLVYECIHFRDYFKSIHNTTLIKLYAFWMRNNPSRGIVKTICSLMHESDYNQKSFMICNSKYTRLF